MAPRSALLPLISAGFLAAPATSFSQDTASTDAPEAGAESLGLEEVLVTARRREEKAQDVPISVSALSGDALERAGIQDVQSLQYHTPSLAITTTFSQRNVVAFSLRGQRTQETQLFTDPPVGTYFAEVVQPRPYGFGNALFDLESVQVLKGVQGTLFGRNMTGGAVLVEPRHPVLGETSAEVRASAGNFQLKELFGVANFAAGDTFAVRLAGRTSERDGWAREVSSGRDYDDRNYDTVRLSGLFEPSDRFNSLTILDWYRSQENGTAAFLTTLAQPSVISNYEALRQFGLITTNVPAEFAAAQALFRQRQYGLDTGAGEGGNLDAFGAPFEDVENYGATNKTTWEINDSLTLKNIAGYRRNTRDTVQDFDGIPAFLITPNQFARINNYSEELQLQGTALDQKLTYIVGGYYFKEEGIDGARANTLPQLTFAGAGVPQSTSALLFEVDNPGEGSSTTYAGFLAGTYRWTDQWSTSAGVRYNYDKREITVSPSRPNLQACQWDLDLIAPGIQSVPFSQCRFSNEKSFNEVTYDATLQYEPSESVTTYASFRHGFRAGGFSTRAQNAIQLRPFLPEFVNEYELGLKTSGNIGGAAVRTNVALFLQNGTDVQKQRSLSFDTDGDGSLDTILTVVDNTAKQRNTGGELELGLSKGLFGLNGYYSYTQIKIREGAAISPMGTTEIAQRGVPKHQAGLTGTVDVPLSASSEALSFLVNLSWRSENFLDDFELEGRQPSYALLNLRAEWSGIRDTGLSVALFGNNVTDKEYRIGVLGLIAEGLGFQSSVYGEPRTYGAEVAYKF